MRHEVHVCRAHDACVGGLVVKCQDPRMDLQQEIQHSIHYT